MPQLKPEKKDCLGNFPYSIADTINIFNGKKRKRLN
jgi:hypothetical protein